MNLLSSNERFGTGSPAHSSIGVPFSPNPLNKSSVRASRSVVGASCMDWDPETEFGSVTTKVSATTTKSITTTSFSDFTYFSSYWLGHMGPNGKRVVFRGWPDFRGTLLTRGALRPGEPERRTPRVFIRQVMWSDLPVFAKDRATFYSRRIIWGEMKLFVAKAASNCYWFVIDTGPRFN